MVSEVQRSLLAIAAAALFTANLPQWFVSLAPTYVASTSFIADCEIGWYARDRPSFPGGYRHHKSHSFE